MLKVGVTGGIGSGKSTVCNILRNLGVPIFTSDLEARKLLNTDEQIKEQIKTTFDVDMYTSAGTLDRERMSKCVFNNVEELEKLNNIVHPRVNEVFELWAKKHERRPYVVKEAAILFETGNHKKMDKVVTVFCPKKIRIQRIIERDQVTKEQVEKRMIFQFTDEERNTLADFIVLNDGVEDLLPQVMELHEIFLNNEKTKTKVIFS